LAAAGNESWKSTLHSDDRKKTMHSGILETAIDSGSNVAFTLIWPLETVSFRSQGLKLLFFKEIWC